MRPIRDQTPMITIVSLIDGIVKYKNKKGSLEVETALFVFVLLF